jgi:hypothetical protein
MIIDRTYRTMSATLMDKDDESSQEQGAFCVGWLSVIQNRSSVGTGEIANDSKKCEESKSSVKHPSLEDSQLLEESKEKCLVGDQTIRWQSLHLAM